MGWSNLLHQVKERRNSHVGSDLRRSCGMETRWRPDAVRRLVLHPFRLAAWCERLGPGMQGGLHPAISIAFVPGIQLGADPVKPFDGTSFRNRTKPCAENRLEIGLQEPLPIVDIEDAG